MTRKNKKNMGIILGITSGIVGTISIGTIAGASVDHSNYKKIKQEFDKKIDNFTKFNKKLKQNHDDLVNIIKDEPLEDEVKAQLNMILDSYNKQMQLNKELSDELINIQKSQDKYKVGHHFGNNSFLRAKKNLKQYKLIKERIPEAVVETETILNISQVEHLQKIFDKCEKLACEVYNLRDSDNFLIKSIENKDTKFNELKLAIDNYKKQKENDEFKKEKKLTKDYILSGLKLLSEDYKVWDEGTLAKFNENKNTNSISKKIISNTEIETIQTSVGLDISKYQQAKNILAKYFTDEGKIIKHKISPSRSTILSDLKSANESINEFNNEMIKHNTNLITSLKEKLDNSKVLEQTTLLDYSVQKANYDNLYLLNNEITKYSSNNNNWELEKASEIIHKSLDLISKEKNQTSTLITFIDNSIKSKFKNLNVNLDFLMEKLKLHSEWNEVEEFAKQSSENLTNLKTEQYISKRNEVIDSFIKIKTHINKLREESIKLWDYGKHRLNAFKTSYESVKSELDTFNTFGFSYSTINDQLNENKTLLTKNADKTFETTSDLLEFLNSLTLTKELEDVDSKNFNIVKNTVTTNINNKLSLGIKIAHTKLDGYKQLIELSDANVLKDGIDTKNKLLQAINSIDWENGNIDDVKNLFDKSFKLITEINNKIIELETLKNKYNNFLDAVENNLRELKNIAEPYLKNQQMNINAKNKIVQKASKDYLNVDSTTDFTNKLNSKNIKEDYMTSWTKIFNEYNLNGFILFCPPCFYLLFCPFLGFNYYFKKGEFKLWKIL